ncbi:MAG: patatin-like phospholipase family protein [Fluviibacter sp.]|jgi:NTE family protein
MTRKKIAIACQGGGSQTAFTAGVLQGLFAAGVQNSHEILAITGTSGGALNAALAWYGLLKNAAGDSTPVQQRIADFWDELKASEPMEQWVDMIATQMLRASGAGYMPRLESSPSSQFSQMLQKLMGYLLPRTNYTDFKGLIESHIDFAEAARLNDPDQSTTLLMGAADVLKGKMKIFNSREDAITPETIMASAAIPSVFPATQIGEDYYWDGLFSSNPPLSPLIRQVHMGHSNFPDEIWIVMIDPLEYHKVPTAPDEILERRTQMTSNISLVQDIEKIALSWIMVNNGGVKPEFLESMGFSHAHKLRIRFIKISEEIQNTLDYSSKLSRSPQLIDGLIAEGKLQAASLMASLNEPGLTPMEALQQISA